MNNAIVQAFVLAGFLCMAITFVTWGTSRHRFWVPGVAVVCFAVALVIHVIGLVSS